MARAVASRPDVIRYWRENPVASVQQWFGVTPDAWQAETLNAYRDGNRVAMKAAKGPGKTTVLAWIIWNFLATRRDSNVAVTSISGDNLRDGLWKELAKWQQRSPFLMKAFEWQKERIVSRSAPATWWASARQWSKSADAQSQSLTLAGLHAEHMLFVIDEAGGVPLSVSATAEAALSTGADAKFVIAGNPTHTEGPLWMACSQFKHLWHVIEVTGDPDDPNRSPRISAEWARQQIDMFGRDNAWVLVNVFGQFPPASLNALLGPDEVTAAMKRSPQPADYTWAQKRLGIDVARFGDDRTVLFPRQGLQAFNPAIMRGARTTEIAARIMLAQKRWGADGEQILSLIDDTGHWGHGVIDNLVAASFAPIPVVFHAPATDPRYRNRRAEMWIEMSEWIKRGGALPHLPELVAELTTPTYMFAGGKFQLEEKDQIKARLGRSPDLADALALTFAIPDMPSNPDMPYSWRGGTGKVECEYDPFAVLDASTGNYDPFDERRRY